MVTTCVCNVRIFPGPLLFYKSSSSSSSTLVNRSSASVLSPLLCRETEGRALALKAECNSSHRSFSSIFSTETSIPILGGLHANRIPCVPGRLNSDPRYCPRWYPSLSQHQQHFFPTAIFMSMVACWSKYQWRWRQAKN
jgi:hypothetical protein